MIPFNLIQPQLVGFLSTRYHRIQKDDKQNRIHLIPSTAATTFVSTT